MKETRDRIRTALEHPNFDVSAEEPMDEADALSEKIWSAFISHSAKYAVPKGISSESREGDCAVDSCGRKSYASGYCNAHYIRHRKGLDLTTPVRNRRRGEACVDCGESIGVKGGWFRCGGCYSKERKRLVKSVCIDHKGGVCSKCNGSFPQRVFDFHHLGDKDGSPSEMMANRSVEVISEEIAKCVLLCANCHRLEHNEDDI